MGNWPCIGKESYVYYNVTIYNWRFADPGIWSNAIDSAILYRTFHTLVDVCLPGSKVCLLVKSPIRCMPIREITWPDKPPMLPLGYKSSPNKHLPYSQGGNTTTQATKSGIKHNIDAVLAVAYKVHYAISTFNSDMCHEWLQSICHAFVYLNQDILYYLHVKPVSRNKNTLAGSHCKSQSTDPN